MKTNKKRIVCGTDFSIHAREAADVAAALACALNETLVLVHGTENIRRGLDIFEAIDPTLDELRECLHDEADRLRQTSGAHVKEELLAGPPATALLEVARRPSTRLMVVSSLGKVAARHFLVGSVAERVAEHAPVPTLVVRNPRPFAAWLSGAIPLKVLVGYDFSVTADHALAWAGGLEKVGPTDLTVGHVAWRAEEQRRDDLRAAFPLVDIGAKTVEQETQRLATSVNRVLGGQPAAVRVKPRRLVLPANDLIDIGTRAKCDLIVVGTHQRHGMARLLLGSVSRAILHHAPTSVAIVPLSLRDPLAGGDRSRKRPGKPKERPRALGKGLGSNR